MSQPKPPSAEQLTEWERLTEAATPEPWEATTDCLGDGVFQERVGGFAITRSGYSPAGDATRMQADSRFAAAARPAMPVLLREAREAARLRVENAGLLELFSDATGKLIAELAECMALRAERSMLDEIAKR